VAVLIIMSGDRKGERIEVVRKQTGIGRGEDNGLALDGASISGHHCEVVRDGNAYSIRDLGSTNGTRLNGEPVQEERLKPKDLISAGGIEIMIDGDDIDVGETPEEPPAAEDPGMAVSRETPGTVSAAFGAKRDSRGTWFVFIGLLIVLALGAMGWFLYSLFSS